MKEWCQSVASKTVLLWQHETQCLRWVDYDISTIPDSGSSLFPKPGDVVGPHRFRFTQNRNISRLWQRKSVGFGESDAVLHHFQALWAMCLIKNRFSASVEDSTHCLSSCFVWLMVKSESTLVVYTKKNNNCLGSNALGMMLRAMPACQWMNDGFYFFRELKCSKSASFTRIIVFTLLFNVWYLVLSRAYTCLKNKSGSQNKIE